MLINNDVYVVLSFVSMFFCLFIYSTKALHHLIFSMLLFFFVISLILLNMFWLGCNYFTGEGINWAVVYTLTNTLTGAAIKELLPQASLLFSVLIVALGVVFYFIFRRRSKKDRKIFYNGFSFFFLVLAIACSPLSHQTSKLIKDEVIENKTYAKDFFQYYISPGDIIKNPKYNLVYIYGESLEHAFFEKERFPGLTKDIDALNAKRVDFNNTLQYTGMDFTIGGIVSSQCGLPLLTPVTFGDAVIKDGFFSDSICLGDILKKSGYDNYYYQGADIRFSDKIDFFRKHGYDHVYGLMESGLQDNFAVQGSWGLYDNVTLSLVWDKFKELSVRNKRFSIFTLTVDTHPPKGVIPPECVDNDYKLDGKHIDTLSAVLCSQHAIADLINKIMTSPWADNTVVVLSSDHLATAENAYIYDHEQAKKRSTTFFLFKKGQGTEPISKIRNTMDNGATVLEVMGGGANIGLGRSSLSRTSLSERFKNFSEKLNAWHPYIKERWSSIIRENRIDINIEQRTITIGGYKYSLPVLIYKDDDRYIPLNNQYGLRFNLYRAKIGVKFFWIDQCYRQGNVWDASLSLSQDWCFAQGILGGDVKVKRISEMENPKEIIISESIPHRQTYQRDVDLLRRPNEYIHYNSNTIYFGLDGTPDNVKKITGLSQREMWGRWSDLNLAPSIKIQYKNKLPVNFEMVIQAKAWNKNIEKPVAINIGEQKQYLKLHKELETYRLSFTNVDSDTIEIVPPVPEVSWQGSQVGAPEDGTLRKIGVGLGTLKIEPLSN